MRGQNSTLFRTFRRPWLRDNSFVGESNTGRDTYFSPALGRRINLAFKTNSHKIREGRLFE